MYVFDCFSLFTLQTHHLLFVTLLCLSSVNQSSALRGEFYTDL